MRKGSTVLGSLGVISAEITLLILPLLAAGAVVNEVLFPPRPSYAAETASQPEETLSPEEEAAQREALERRKGWLDKKTESATKPTTPSKAAKAPAKRVKPVKVINTRATWYGPGFHGRRTANGERFSRHAMTLASRHLPFGTRVRVVNPKTGRSVVARVNDRGPFRRGYTADLSQAVARKIGLGGSGPVRLEILPKTAKPKTR
jgi:rare lipoprotein A